MSSPPIEAAHEPVSAVCAAMYYADLIPAHAFVFRVPSTDTRFTVYTDHADRYLIGTTYTLTITEPDNVPLWLSVQRWQFLHHCLGTLEQRWHEAITEADAGAERP